MPVPTKFKFVLSAISVLTLTSAVSWAGNPSFKCSSTNTRVEQAICRSDMLSGLDVQLSAIFRRTFSTIPQGKRPGFRRDQLNWLQWRNTCGANDTCLQRRYVNRIDELLGKPAVRAPAKSGAPELQLQTAEKAQ